MTNQNDEKTSFSVDPKVEEHRQMILDARQKGKLATLGVFTRLSGPGWLQSAITLGGGSLSNALYLGVLGGFCFMWLQPLAMILGVIMLSAIAFVTLSTGRRPLRDINTHVSPVLGWGWLIASMMANLVWSLPQFALATAAIQQNLFPNIFGPEAMPNQFMAKVITSLIVLVITVSIVMIYNQGGTGQKIFETIVKIMVGAIVISFFGVVIKLTMNGNLPWNEIWAGFIPDFNLLFQPAPSFSDPIAQVGEKYQEFWRGVIVSDQRDVMIGAAATAVGINMTFLLPYSMIRKGWDKDFRGLAIFDLSTGLFIPFMLATACVVIASSSQFHAVPAPGLVQEETTAENIEADPKLVPRYQSLMLKRIQFGMTAEEVEAFQALPEEQRLEKIDAMPIADRRMAAMLVKRDAFDLADTLKPLTGDTIARYVFGFGVLGMALNAATMLMLINGLCFCELMNRPAKGWTQKIGSLMVMVGILGPFFWGTSRAQMWLAVPTSVFAMVLLPIAYFAFLFLMNQRKVLGDKIPKGSNRIIWNTLMAIACVMAGMASLWVLYNKLQLLGIVLFIVFIILVLAVHFFRKPAETPNE